MNNAGTCNFRSWDSRLDKDGQLIVILRCHQCGALKENETGMVE